MLRNKWNFLYLVLAALIVFTLLAVPRIAISTMNRTKEQIVTVTPK